MLGVSEPAIRRLIADGSLTSIRVGRGRRVLLVGDPPIATSALVREPAKASSQEDDAVVLARTSESLSILVRDLQRQSLALAGQIGYLQHQLSEALDQVRVLQTRQDNTVDGAENASVQANERQLVLREVASLREAVERLQTTPEVPAKRRWWRRR